MSYNKFLKKLKKAKLLAQKSKYSTPPFFSLDLPCGPVSIKPDPHTVFNVVRIAHKSGLGNLHELILGLNARERELANSNLYVFWRKPVQDERRSSMISLDDWLKSHKYDTSKFSSKKIPTTVHHFSLRRK